MQQTTDTRSHATTIVASLGPTLSTEADIAAALEFGCDFRQPFGYRIQDHFGEFQVVERLRRVAAKGSNAAGEPQAQIYVDLPSERPRVGLLRCPLELHVGQQITVASLPESTDSQQLPVPGLSHFISAFAIGHRILVRDGTVVLRIRHRNAQTGTLTAEAEHSTQAIETNNNLMFPDSAVQFAPITDADRALLHRYRQAAFAPDWVMLSLIAATEQVGNARRELQSIFGENSPKLMVKIETSRSVELMPELLQVADGLLVGRGDLGMTMPPECIPAIQEDVVNACRQASKPVLVATEFLQRFAETAVPNRAELSDVALAVRQGVAGIVLTKETSSSPHVLQTVRLARKIIAVELARARANSHSKQLQVTPR